MVDGTPSPVEDGGCRVVVVLHARVLALKLTAANAV
jgi:hypothetical protein